MSEFSPSNFVAFLNEIEQNIVSLAGENRLAGVKLCLAAGIDPNYRDRDKFTALSKAVGHKNFEMAKLLLVGGADPNLKSNSSTPLMVAAEDGNLKLIKLLLLHGAEVNAKDYNKNTALLKTYSYYWRARNEEDRLKIAKILLAKGADPLAKDSEERTVLFGAAEQGFLEAIDFFIDLGVDVNARDKSGCSALSNAFHSKEYTKPSEIVAKLLAHGANPNTQSDFGETPLMHASSSGDLDSVKLLLAAGGDPNLVARNGETALCKAVMYHKKSVIPELIDAGADPKIRYNDRWSVFESAKYYADKGIDTEMFAMITKSKSKQARSGVKTGLGAGLSEVVARGQRTTRKRAAAPEQQ